MAAAVTVVGGGPVRRQRSGRTSNAEVAGDVDRVPCVRRACGDARADAVQHGPADGDVVGLVGEGPAVAVPEAGKAFGDNVVSCQSWVSMPPDNSLFTGGRWRGGTSAAELARRTLMPQHRMY